MALNLSFSAALLTRRRDDKQPERYRRPNIADKMPRTQELIEAVGAKENCLILRDHSVIGAVGFRSIDSSLLTTEDIVSRLTIYAEFLCSTRFEFQLLIGTRPQDLTQYYDKLVLAMEQHEKQIVRVLTLSDRFPEFVSQGQAAINDAGFAQFFGFGPNDFIGTPGKAHETALDLCDWQEARLFFRLKPAQRKQLITQLRADIHTTVAMMMHWQDVLAEQLETVQLNVLHANAPVRTFFIVVSHNPRIRSKIIPKGPMTEKEFARARSKLDEMCRLIKVFFGNMGMEAWRATDNDLLDDIRHFFNPANSIATARVNDDAREAQRERLTLPDFEMRRAFHATA